MDVQAQKVSELDVTLERLVELQSEAAKRAIHEYHRSILQRSITDNDQRIQIQRRVEQEVREYIELRKQLDEIRSQRTTNNER